MGTSNEVSGCWAAPLGSCGGVLSHEHLISECLFPGKEIHVRGFSWCPDVKPLRIETLTAKILCEKHNRELSELDASVKDSLEALRDSVILFTRRSSLRSRRWTIRQFTVNMLLLERWCMKTLINFNYKGKWRMNPESSALGVPSKELIEIAFGRRKFEDAGGLYLVTKKGASITLLEGAISVGATTDGDRLVAGRFDLWGYPFVLSILPSPITMTDGSLLMRHEIKQWFQTHDDKGRLVKSHLVTCIYPK
jgi:hypothetical protein